MSEKICQRVCPNCVFEGGGCYITPHVQVGNAFACTRCLRYKPEETLSDLLVLPRSMARYCLMIAVSLMVGSSLSLWYYGYVTLRAFILFVLSGILLETRNFFLFRYHEQRIDNKEWLDTHEDLAG